MSAEALARAREMRARPVLRLQCPTGEHGPGVIMYAKITDGWCHCGRKLRPMLPTEKIQRGEGTGRVPGGRT